MFFTVMRKLRLSVRAEEISPVSPRFSSAMAWRTRTWSSAPKPSSWSSPGDSTGSAPVPTKVPSRNNDTGPGSTGEPFGRISLA